MCSISLLSWFASRFELETLSLSPNSCLSFCREKFANRRNRLFNKGKRWFQEIFRGKAKIDQGKFVRIGDFSFNHPPSAPYSSNRIFRICGTEGDGSRGRSGKTFPILFFRFSAPLLQEFEYKLPLHCKWQNLGKCFRAYPLSKYPPVYRNFIDFGFPDEWAFREEGGRCLALRTAKSN